MAVFQNSISDFNLDELDLIKFGQLEGEKDSFLVNTFYPTKSIRSILTGRYNYILSPKGGGKSALFKAIKLKLPILSGNEFALQKFSVISINEAFGYESDYLSLSNFREEENRKTYSVSWAIYLLIELLKDIQTNHKDKKNYTLLISSIKKVKEIKEVFKLYNLSDIINQLNVGLSFNVGGQQIDMKPKIGVNDSYEKIDLNTLFKTINSFYKDNNRTARILIDRLDNFVNRQELIIQKNYIQGLIDCIEELSMLQNIHIELFIRTDLYYSFDLDFEYDKLKERTVNLTWDKNEIFNFLVFRLLANQNIQETYFEYFLSILSKDILFVKRGFIKSLRMVILKTFKQSRWRHERLEELRSQKKSYQVSDKFIYLFIPRHVGVLNTDIFSWITLYLSDAHSFLNPRLLIYFFNELIIEQVTFNEQNISHIKSVKAKYINGHFEFEIFNQECIQKTYEKIQNNELINIYKLLKKKELQELFMEVHLKGRKGLFNPQELKTSNNIKPELIQELMRRLVLLGYCKQFGSSLPNENLFEIPKLFQRELNLQFI